MLRKTYEIQRGGPSALDWDQYRALIKSDWRKLLDDYEATEEDVYQDFLEQHPCLVPGCSGMMGTSGHAPILDALFSQPKLPDFTCKIPDFMWIAKDSQSVYPILIEIEAPSKRWFNKGGDTTSHFNHAMGQLLEWKTWFANPLNRIAFAKHYDLNLEFRHLKPHYVLIYGRRHEANRDKILAEKRQHLQHADVTTMTFDRLEPNWTAHRFMSVRAKKNGYVARYVPASFQLGPMNADEVAKISEFDEAINRSPYLTPERRAFLISRIPYWQRWARTENMCVRNPGDVE